MAVAAGTAAAQTSPFKLTDTTDDYLHGVFGQDFEWSQLSGPNGEVLYQPDGKVLEDRWVQEFDLDRDGKPEVLLIEANAAVGANPVLVELAQDEAGNWAAESASRGPSIGIGFRWMNPLEGSVDVDGDGVDEIAIMTTPHIGGPVVIYRWTDGELVPIQRLDVPRHLSNHRYGDPVQQGSKFGRDEQGRLFAELRLRNDWRETERIYFGL